ncbi:hypothetical protein [Sphaerisporangium album]|uniref:hypothetical protein n=1 Tax=Sphaerisporangium album TaxID=509200 RepID=UPI0011C062B5|nr:hypothetical protein [Sphaerisporangium album]
MSTPSDVPPPAYFYRSVPVMPTGAWLRAKLVTQGPYAAGLVVALAAGFGLALGLGSSCPPAAPPHPHSARDGGPSPPSLLRRHSIPVFLQAPAHLTPSEPEPRHARKAHSAKHRKAHKRTNHSHS